MTVLDILKGVGINTGYFALGFVVGTVIDIIFAMIYKKLDPERKMYDKRIIAIVIVQILVLIGMLSWILTVKHNQADSSGIHRFMIHFGFVSSQFYLFDYISKYIGSLLMRYPNKFPERPVRDISRTFETDENA